SHHATNRLKPPRYKPPRDDNRRPVSGFEPDHQIIGLMRRTLLIVTLLVVGCLDVRAAPGDDADLPPVLLSRQLMRDAKVNVGDAVVLAAEPDAPSRRFRVAGVYEPVPDPMKFNTARYEARLHLPDLIALTADLSNPQAADTVTAINL